MNSTKDFRAELKALTEAGTGTAIVARLNVVDLDGDYTVAGAFSGNRGPVPMQPAHDSSAPAIGSAKLYEDADLVLADFRLNLDMQSGREWYLSMKQAWESGAGQQFSYGYRVLDSEFSMMGSQRVRILKKVQVTEISPVLTGAGVGTGLVSLKSCQHCGGKSSQGPAPRSMSSQAEETFDAVERAILALEQLAGREESILDLRGRLSHPAESRLKRISESVERIQSKAVDLHLLEVEMAEHSGQFRDPHIVEAEQVYLKSLEQEYFRLMVASVSHG